MRALWLEDQQLRLRDDLPPPQPPPGEALVRVLIAGICNTDIELTRGYYPFTGVPGHEFVGEVDGRRVVGEINVVCGSCDSCRRGHSSHCERRTVLGIAGRNGAFAEYLTLPVGNLHPVPDEISNQEAVFTEPLAAALEIQEQVKITPEDRVLVVGEGKLGQLVAQTLALTGCSLTVAGHHRNKLALLESRGIETRVIPSEARNLGAGSHRPDPSLTLGMTGCFDIAVECTGNPSGFALARRALRPRGTLVMKSTYAGDLTMNTSSLVVDEITLIGSRCGPFAPALRLLREKLVDVRPLIHAAYPLDEILSAFEQARRPGALKILVTV